LGNPEALPGMSADAPDPKIGPVAKLWCTQEPDSPQSAPP